MDPLFWNERYHENETLYGNKPNEFFRQQLEKLVPGRILLPAEGEARNAIYAARQGWTVDAFDFSEEAVKKGLANATKAGVKINYEVNDIGTFQAMHRYDAVALIYVHHPREIISQLIRTCIHALLPGGTFFLECFSKEQLMYSSGGPKDVTMLYDPAELVTDLAGLKLTLNNVEKIELDEGPFHHGPASVIRVVGIRH